MARVMTITLMTAALGILCCGCMGRLFSEGMGATRGASGKSVDMGAAGDFAKYKSLRIEAIDVSPGLHAPADMAGMIRTNLAAAAEERGLAHEGNPGLRLSAEIIHYETGSVVDTAIGPLEEVVVRATLTDAQSGNVVAETNLIGRSKATSSSGAKHLSAAVGKAMDKWLKEGGL